MKKDNAGFARKVSLRVQALRECEATPLILETHGGKGAIFAACYAEYETGVVFDTDPRKAERLAIQRPGWRVYNCRAELAINAGVAKDLAFNFIDIDPYGSPWPVIDSVFNAPRAFAPKLTIVVNDGLRQRLKMTGGWDVDAMHDAVRRFGAALYDSYLEACQWMLEEKAGQLGYELTRWAGYYTGHMGQMTHYAAVLSNTGGSR